jgi:hypothetical protein
LGSEGKREEGDHSDHHHPATHKWFQFDLGRCELVHSCGERKEKPQPRQQLKI